MRPGTLWDGLEYSWLWFGVAAVTATAAALVLIYTKQKITRYLVGATLVVFALAGLLVGSWMFGLDKDCRSAEPNEYERRLQESGLN